MATRFTFKLDAVLEQRKHAEHQRQREMATAQQKVLRLQAELDAMAAVKRASSADLRAAGRRISAATLAAHQRFAAAMREKQATLGRQIAEAQLEMDVAQSALLEAAKQRKVMEKLREREQTRWQAAQRRREQVEADEVTARAACEAALDAVI